MYLRWVNACLRYELRHSHAATAGDGADSALNLNKARSPRSQVGGRALAVCHGVLSRVPWGPLGGGARTVDVSACLAWHGHSVPSNASSVVHAFVRACVRACVRVCVCVYVRARTHQDMARRLMLQYASRVEEGEEEDDESFVEEDEDEDFLSEQLSGYSESMHSSASSLQDRLKAAGAGAAGSGSQPSLSASVSLNLPTIADGEGGGGGGGRGGSGAGAGDGTLSGEQRGERKARGGFFSWRRSSTATTSEEEERERGRGGSAAGDDVAASRQSEAASDASGEKPTDDVRQKSKAASKGDPQVQAAAGGGASAGGAAEREGGRDKTSGKARKMRVKSAMELSAGDSFLLLSRAVEPPLSTRSKGDKGAHLHRPTAFRDRHVLAEQRQLFNLQQAEAMAGLKRSSVAVTTAGGKAPRVPEVERRDPRVPSAPPRQRSTRPKLLDEDTELTEAAALLNRAVGGIPVPPPLPPPMGGPPLPPAMPKDGNLSAASQGSSGMRRAPEVVELYQSLMKMQRQQAGEGVGGGKGGEEGVSMAAVRGDMIGEIENRSSHLLAVSQA